MPYIITTASGVCTSEDPKDHQGDTCPIHEDPLSRHAVATLEEAREIAFDLIDARNPHATEDEHDAGAIAPGDAHDLPEAGGTIGPLADGTVIEVARVKLRDILNPTDWRDHQPTTAELIDAYNARETAV
jgi:hypothetical protein